MLEIKNINSFYSKSHVLQGVSLTLEKGTFSCLLGRNGVGKTTLLHTIMGIVKQSSGNIILNGDELKGLQPFKIARKGIGLVPETRRIFRSLTVEQNIVMGGLGKKGAPPVENAWTIDKIYQLFPRLKERSKQKGIHLSGGEQQMLTLARTLVGNPEVLLVDEPTEGLSPIVAKSVMELLRDINSRGVTILIVEQQMRLAIKYASYFFVMGKGEIVFEGDKDLFLKSASIRTQYLEI